MYKHKRIFTQSFGVVSALIEKDGKILLIREQLKNNPRDNGKWNHPAGWIEVGEHPIEAIKKEVLEETGYEFTPTHLLGVYSLLKRNPEKTEHPIKLVYLGEISEDPISELHADSLEIKWFTPEEIEKMDSSVLRDPDIRQIMKDYFAGKKFPLQIVTHSEFDIQPSKTNL